MARIFPGSIFSSIQRKFTDIFSARANTTGGLGASTSGAVWNAINGVINVTSGAATTTTTPNPGASGSSYPISTVPMPTFDNVIKLSGTNEGSAVALWVQSSSDWWMVNVEGTQVTNTNYAGVTYWSYNYTSTNANVPYYAMYAWTAKYTQPSYTTSFATSGAYTVNALPNSYYAVFASQTNYGAYTPYSTTIYYYGTYNPYTSGYGAVAYTKLSPTYYLSSGGGTTYTSGPTAYYSAKDITGYTAGTSYFASGVVYSVIPPGYSVATPYSTVPQYTWSYTSTTPYSAYVASGSDPAFAGYTVTTITNYTTSQSYYTYAAGTTTTYSEYLKLKRSVANTVSEISSTLISNTQTIKSILVSILGTQITAKAYSDSNLVTQIGSDLVYTATGATVTTQYGIGVSPSSYNQSAIIGTSIEISRN